MVHADCDACPLRARCRADQSAFISGCSCGHGTVISRSSRHQERVDTVGRIGTNAGLDRRRAAGCWVILFVLIGKIPGLGRLPGDILIKRENVTIYIPLGTMILVSIVLTLLLNLIARWRR